MIPKGKKRLTTSSDEWLIHAQSDLKLAKIGLDHDVLPEQICFHAQQAVEKALKSVLLYKNIEFPFTHDLKQLLDMLAMTGLSIPDEILRADELTPYAVETRYPGFWEKISENDVAEAIAIAENTLEWAIKILKKKNR